MQSWDILKRKKTKKDMHPSSLIPYYSFSTALSQGEKTFKCSGNHSASPKGSACNYRPTGRTRAQLPAPAATSWGLYMEIRWNLLTSCPAGSKNPGKLFGVPSTARWALPGVQRRGCIAKTRAPRKAPVALLPSANTNITYVGTDALRVEPSRSTARKSHLP